MSELDEQAKTVACPTCGVPAGDVCVASQLKGLGGAPATAHAHEKRIEKAKRSERGGAAK